MLPSGDRVTLGGKDAEALVEALWGASTRRGAASAIGKIRHGLRAVDGDSEVEVSPDEAGAIAYALDSLPAERGALAQLRRLTA